VAPARPTSRYVVADSPRGGGGVAAALLFGNRHLKGEQMLRVLSRIVTFVGSLSLALSGSVSTAQDWVDQSNEHTQRLMTMEAEFSPERASLNGLSQYDGLTSDFGPKLLERRIEAAEMLLNQYNKLLETENDPLVAQDLQILIDKLAGDIEGDRLQQKFMLDWTNLPETIFQVTSAMLSEQTPPERRASVVELLNRYTGLHPGTQSAFEQAKAMWKESQGDAKIGPYRADVERALANFPTYAVGVRQLVEEFGLDGAAAALGALDVQTADYADWVRANVLPAARDDFRLPPEIYAYSLRQAGVDIDPETLIQRARVEFFETRATMDILAPIVAEKFGLEKAGYREVIAALKQAQIPESELEETYSDVLKKLEQAIIANRVLTLPGFPVRMRLASAAESAAQPAPHMQPPPLIGNTGQQGEFVLTTSSTSTDDAKSYDDFSFDAAAWTLSAHEGRPGHELQFASMIDRGVSYARALYAFNNVNVEGWALYAEAEMVPFEPVEGQLIAMQHRLLRAARAFLDPMLNLGMISVKDAARILREEVMLSSAMVDQEINRYTFKNPGQAPSYFYGYTRLLSLRVATETALGERFDRMAFNDFILGQGLLPPGLMAAAVENGFIPSAIQEGS